MEALIAKFIEWIKESEHIVFFGGAGVSTESGIPDFRSKDGLYNQHDVQFDKYQPEYLLSHTCLMREPEVFFEFYRQKMDSRGSTTFMAAGHSAKSPWHSATCATEPK